MAREQACCRTSGPKIGLPTITTRACYGDHPWACRAPAPAGAATRSSTSSGAPLECRCGRCEDPLLAVDRSPPTGRSSFSADATTGHSKGRSWIFGDDVASMGDSPSGPPLADRRRRIGSFGSVIDDGRPAASRFSAPPIPEEIEPGEEARDKRGQGGDRRRGQACADPKGSAQGAAAAARGRDRGRCRSPARHRGASP